MKSLLAVLKGLFYGYVAYLPLMLAVEYAFYRRVDGEKAFYALYYPFGAPFLIVPSGWKHIQADEVVLNFLGAALLIAGVAFALRVRREAAR